MPPLPPNQNWQSLGAAGLFGTNTALGGGGTPVQVRSELDARRMGLGRTPQAEYPDGYLGTIRSRRDDRLLDSLKVREGQRSYQRGVHKGERIDPADYLWPPDLKPDRGLKREARAVYDNGLFLVRREVPRLEDAGVHLKNGGKGLPLPKGAGGLVRGGNAQPPLIDPKRRGQLAHLIPAAR